MYKKIQIGDKVIINSKDVIKIIGHLPKWYTTDIYTVCGIIPSSEKLNDIIILDKILMGYSNQIHETYITTLKQLRKEKLEKLNENRR